MAKIFGNVVSVTFEWEAYIYIYIYIYIYGWVILEITEKEKEIKANRRQNREEKKGEELEGKGQVLLEGRGTIGCYSVVSVIVGVRPLMH